MAGIPVKPGARSGRYARDRLGAQPRSNLVYVFMMPLPERCTEIQRVQISDQCNAPMPQRNAAIKQRERRVGIALLACKLGKTGGFNAR
jgi:hypothetical protein